MKKQIVLVVTVFILSMLMNMFYADTKENPPADIELLFDGYCRELLTFYPEYASRLGINEEKGYKIEKDTLTDVSDEALDRLYALKRKYRRWLDTYDRSKLTPSQRCAADILILDLDNDLQGEIFRDHEYIINPNLGFHNQLTSLMTEHHSLNHLNDAKAYISRLKAYENKIRQLSKRLETHEKKGILPPIYIIDKFDRVMSQFIHVDVKDNVLYSSFVRRIEKLNLDDKLKETLIQEVKNSIEIFVYPAYKKFIEHMRRVKKKADTDAGVWKLPQGDKYYEYCLRIHTSTFLKPKEIHKLGLKEVKRIQGEIRRLLALAGYRGGGTFRELLSQFWRWEYTTNRDSMVYPNTESSRRKALEDYQKIIDDVRLKLPALFSIQIQPKRSVIVKPVPPFKESTMGAYYESASLDGKRKGVFYVNLTSLPFKPGMKTLTYHEAIPGHHFQTSIEKESSEIRMFRNLLFFTAYIEGWALYAEKLAREQGWYEDLYSKLGNLDSELLRAVRLVIDTGIHYKRWSRKKAYRYMMDNLGWASISEIDRYIVWPGQACAYKIGELKILELRELAKKELKEKFDIKEFHTVVLKRGSVPLTLLEQFVTDYIKEKKMSRG